jgi:hypothetical protein
MNGILLDEQTGDLLMKNGELVIGEVDFQNIDFIIKANKGDFKESPLTGVGAEKYLKSVGKTEELKREIAVQLQAQGYKNPKIEITPIGELQIDV